MDTPPAKPVSKESGNRLIVSKSVKSPVIGITVVFLFLCFYTYSNFFDDSGFLRYLSTGIGGVVTATLLLLVIDEAVVAPLVYAKLQDPKNKDDQIATFTKTHVMVACLTGLVFGYMAGSMYFALSLDPKRWPGLIAFMIACYLGVSFLTVYPFLELCSFAPTQLSKAQCFTSKAVAAHQVHICDYILTTIQPQQPSIINFLSKMGVPSNQSPSETLNQLQTICYGIYGNSTRNISGCDSLPSNYPGICRRIAVG